METFSWSKGKYIIYLNIIWFAKKEAAQSRSRFIIIYSLLLSYIINNLVCSSFWMILVQPEDTPDTVHEALLFVPTNSVC